jgi:hypothetical protein
MPRIYCSKMSRGPFPSANYQAGITKLCAPAVVGIAVTHCVGLLAATITKYLHLITNIYVRLVDIFLFTSTVTATPLTPEAGSFLLFRTLASNIPSTE